ncbi:hypothetical protein HOY82DRAFT_605166 [Tuber indicum]|nr:hypothetical protein HOY82DRAFT_605166 [Tuber indicum]
MADSFWETTTESPSSSIYINPRQSSTTPISEIDESTTSTQVEESGEVIHLDGINTASLYTSLRSPFHELSTLVDDNNKYAFSTVTLLTNMVERQIEACLQSASGHYLLISGVPEDMEVTIDEAFERRQIRHQVRLMYEHNLMSLIIKLMPGIPHEAVTNLFTITIANKIQAIPGHSILSFIVIGSGRFRARGGKSKEPDSGIRPATRKSDEFPSLVLEVGYSQTMRALRCDARWWLLNSNMRTKMVLIMKLSRNPVLLEIESWIMIPNPPRRVTRNRPLFIPVCDQYIGIDSIGTVVIDPPGNCLTIPYQTIFDVPNLNEVDIAISRNELSTLALHVFHQTL